MTPPRLIGTLGARLGREARRLKAQARKTLLKARIGDSWREDEAASSFRRRRYPDYETYLAHQRLKLDAFRPSSIERHDRRFFAALRERLAGLPVSLAGQRVLCLAARQGTEVRAFIDAGAFAIGIDLNPGRENGYVVTGDFHALQFATGTVDLVYTNSLDHAFELDRVFAEVNRVLTPGGRLLLEIAGGSERGGPYESLSWPSVDAFLDRVTPYGFRLRHRSAFTVPWGGESLLFQRTESA